MPETPAKIRSRRTLSAPQTPTGAASSQESGSSGSSPSTENAAPEQTTLSDSGRLLLDPPSRKGLFDTARSLKALARIIEQQCQGYPDHDLPLTQGYAYEQLQQLIVDVSAVSLTPFHQS